MTLRIRPEAGLDIVEAARWYESREPGLGLALVAELQIVLDRIIAGPERYQRAYGRLRRVRTRRFPYILYFSEEGDDVIVFAVLHQRRNRTVLDERLKD